MTQAIAAPTATSATQVIGVDLSLSCTGLALPDGSTVAVKRPTKRAPASLSAELLDVQWMRDQVMDAVDNACEGIAGRRRLVLVVVEGLAYGSRSPHAMTRAGLFWLLLDALDEHLAAVTAVVSPASRAKYATGRGNAGKDVVMREVARRFPDFLGGEDEADAMVLRAMGMDRLGHPIVAMPSTHRVALDTVVWPEGGGSGGE